MPVSIDRNLVPNVMRLEGVVDIGCAAELQALLLEILAQSGEMEVAVAEGTEMHLEYKHHLEANYCIAGEGEVVDLESGTVHPLRPGSLYALDKIDAHIIRATRGDLRVVCVFNPRLAGDELHRADGSYGPAHDEAAP